MATKKKAWQKFKQTSTSELFKKVAQKWGLHGPTSSTGEFLIKKAIYVYVKHFGINNLHNVWICELTKIFDK